MIDETTVPADQPDPDYVDVVVEDETDDDQGPEPMQSGGSTPIDMEDPKT